jgi:hypothetical protein
MDVFHKKIFKRNFVILSIINGVFISLLSRTNSKVYLVVFITTLLLQFLYLCVYFSEIAMNNIIPIIPIISPNRNRTVELYYNYPRIYTHPNSS